MSSALHLSRSSLHSCNLRSIPATQNRGGRASTTRVFAADSFCKDQVNVRKEVQMEGTAMVTFKGAEGSSVTVEVPKDTYILDAGLEAGLDLPYTCRGGICGACVGRVAEGPSAVDQSDIDDLSFTVDAAEQEQGMALLCMSRPLKDCTIETQSDWGYSLGVGEWKGATGHILGREIDPLCSDLSSAGK